MIDAWPLCPTCGKPRLTVCPVCGTAGSDFPRADPNLAATAPRDPAGVRLPLICSTCDEPWWAEFLRHCEWCGHDFGSGLEIERPAPPTEPASPLNSRALALLLGMAALAILMIAWFLYVGR